MGQPGFGISGKGKAENTQLTFGANMGYGKTGTEYGGFKK